MLISTILDYERSNGSISFPNYVLFRTGLFDSLWGYKEGFQWQKKDRGKERQIVEWSFVWVMCSVIKYVQNADTADGWDTAGLGEIWDV